METYPAAFPCPLAEPYAWSADMGLLRTPMDGGYTRQRRLYDVMPHHFLLEFVLPLEQLHDWQEWVNDNAYEFFELPLISWQSSPSKRPTIHNARFTTDLQFSFEGMRVVRVRVEAELAPSIP